MKIWNYAIASLALLYFSAAHANTAIDTPNRFTGGLLLQDTDYKNDRVNNVDGSILIGGYKTAINPKFAIGGGLGIMFDGSFGNGNKIGNGDGFRLFGDAQYEVHRFNQNQIIITGSLSHDRFSFSETGVDLDFTVTEFKAGAIILRDVRDFSLYGGLELVLYSHGTIEVGNYSGDIKRDDRLNLRIGAAFNATKTFAIRADLLLIGEQTLLLAADFAI